MLHQNNYDINVIASNTADQELQANLNYWEYDDDDRSALKSDPLDFVCHYGHVKPKSSETEKDDDKKKDLIDKHNINNNQDDNNE